MSIGRIRETEVDADKLTASTLADICYEIARGSKKTRQMFNSSKLKPKYAKYGEIVSSKKHGKDFVEKHSGKLLMQAELDEAIESGKTSALERVFAKYNGEEILKLDSKIDISREVSGGKILYTLSESTQKGKISPLQSMFGKVKEDAQEKIGNREQIKAEERHAKEVSELADRESKKAEQKIIDENVRKGRDAFYAGVERKSEMDKFTKELEGGVQEWNREAIEAYGENAPSRAVQKINENPYQKRLDEINGESKSR